MRIAPLVFTIVCLTLIGCQPDKRQTTSVADITTSTCFAQNIPGYQISGNSATMFTPNGNFLKCAALSDSEYIFSCGRENKEFEILTGNCYRAADLPELVYDDEQAIILYNRGGSDSWLYHFVSLTSNKIYRDQALFIDTTNLLYVALLEKDNQVFFTVNRLNYNAIDTLPSKYYQIRQGGYPLFFIENIFVARDTLFYSVVLDDKSIKSDTIPITN